MDLIQCTVELTPEDGGVVLTEIVKSGPDALTPAEAAILMFKLGGGVGIPIKNATVVGQIDRHKRVELARLLNKYGREIVQTVIPMISSMPVTLDDLELPPENRGSSVTPEERLRAEIERLGSTVPKGKLSIADLEALLAEARAEKDDKAA